MVVNFIYFKFNSYLQPVSFYIYAQGSHINIQFHNVNCSLRCSVNNNNRMSKDYYIFLYK